MPRVTQEHRDKRRRQILDAATVCFARKGFHGTSMPDIFAEVGLSSGAVYGYFPSKQAIIEELLGSAMRPVLVALRDAAEVEPPLPVPGIIDLIHREMITVLDSDDATSLILQFWAESMRVSEIRESQRQDVIDLRDAAEVEPPLPVPEIIDLIHREMITVLDFDDATSLILQFWAESMRVSQIRESQRQDVIDLHDALLTLLGRLHPDASISADSAWALIALGLGTFISQTVLKTNSLPTATLVDELRLLLSEP